MTNTPEYRVWTDMRTRCSNRRANSFQYYGARGIKVCARWDSFSAFYADMGPRPSDGHTIEREDVDGDYEPANCRWATRLEQARNKRNTVRVQTASGVKSISELAAAAGMTASGMFLRVKRGRVDLERGSKRNGWITHGDITDTLKGWSGRTGIKVSTISMRLTQYGWSVERALTEGATL